MGAERVTVLLRRGRGKSERAEGAGKGVLCVFMPASHRRFMIACPAVAAVARAAQQLSGGPC